MQMCFVQCLHKLAKKVDRITQVGLSDSQIDETPNDLSVLRWLTWCAGVHVQFQVAIEGSRYWLVVYHVELEQKIQYVVVLGEHDVVVLGEHDVVAGSDDLDVEQEK